MSNSKFNERILDKTGLYLSALSGGADSTALLLMLLDRGYNVEAVHCNFHLRGAESDRDEEFCRRLCEDKGVKFHVVHFDTFAYAEVHHLSIETAARQLRYNYFFSLAHDIGAKGICVAHNKNDQAETMLMKLVRGAGIHGLAGMKPVTHNSFRGDDFLVLRPMLGISRDEIERFLRSRNQSWVVDSTNLETDATRNKFRLEVFPLLESINPSVIDNIAGACGKLADVAAVYDHSINDSIKRLVKGTNDIRIDIEQLLGEISPESVLYEIMTRYGFNGSQALDVFNHIHGVSGRIWKSPSHQLAIDRGFIVVAPLDDRGKTNFIIPEDGTYIISPSKKLRIQTVEWSQRNRIPREHAVVCLDRSKVSFPLCVRTCESGDRFVPFGMRGSKLVSDFLTDNKLSVIDKNRQLVLCDATGCILWIIGLRPDNRFRITSETTSALRIEYCNS